MLFTENGIPETLLCDNGTQFTSAEFQQLAKQYGFEVVTSSPHYPRGHGFVERQVQTVKKTILKCRETREDIDLALLTLQTMPLSSNIPSPAELLNGRTLKSTRDRDRTTRASITTDTPRNSLSYTRTKSSTYRIP